MILVNLFGTPGAGKSTGAAYIYSQLKMNGINAELVTEFAKDKVWEESTEVFNNQAYIFGKQYFKTTRCQNKVEVIVTDSPLLLSVFYNKDELLGQEFNDFVVKVFKSYNSLNYLLLRNKPYNPKGRFQTEEESDMLITPMRDMLDKYDIRYIDKDGDQDNYDEIVNEVLYLINIRFEEKI
jgi:hypothetical protein